MRTIKDLWLKIDNALSAHRKLILFIILFAIFFAGFKPREFFLSNDVSFVDGGNGIHFQEHSLAYYEFPLHDGGKRPSAIDEFSIEIVIRSLPQQTPRFSFIVLFLSGKHEEQFLIGQWRSWLILMNGDDYAHKRKLKRIYLDLKTLPGREHYITVTSGDGGTKLYSDGQQIIERKDIIFSIPEGPANTKLILGNSPYGKHSWEGDILGFAFFKSLLTSTDIHRNYQNWVIDHDFLFQKRNDPYLLYSFDGTINSAVHDHSGGERHLIIPSSIEVIYNEVLALPSRNYFLHYDFIIDVLVNLIGFIPLGLALMSILYKSGGFSGNYRLLILFLLSMLTSLIIEIGQIWMPSRNSSMLDLIMNTSGGMIGGLLYLQLRSHAMKS